MTTQAWHFTVGNKLRDGTPLPPVGEWLVYDGPVKICKSGLHASERLIDALKYAPGLMLHRVTCDDVEAEHGDKFVCRRRRIDASRDVPMRAIVRLAIESACLAAWCAGRYLPDLLVALDACDREDWAACVTSATRDAVWATRAARDATESARSAWAATRDAAWVAWAAWDATRAAWDAVWATLEARAVALLWGE